MNECINTSYGGSHTGSQQRGQEGAINIHGALPGFLNPWIVGWRTACQREYALGSWEEVGFGGRFSKLGVRNTKFPSGILLCVMLLDLRNLFVYLTFKGML